MGRGTPAGEGGMGGVLLGGNDRGRRQSGGVAYAWEKYFFVSDALNFF